MIEVWKDIEGYEGLYQVSNFGRIKSLNYRHTEKEKIVKQDNSSGYKRVTLYKDGLRYRQLVHRLVAEAFIPNPNNLPEINHKDECTSNNVVTNIEWCMPKYNCNYGTRMERITKTKEKGVVQLTTKGEFIERFKSIANASRETGIDRKTIRECCQGNRNNQRKYIWKYSTEYDSIKNDMNFTGALDWSGTTETSL